MEINALLARSGFAALPLEGRLQEPNPQVLRSAMAQVIAATAFYAVLDFQLRESTHAGADTAQRPHITGPRAPTC